MKRKMKGKSFTFQREKKEDINHSFEKENTEIQDFLLERIHETIFIHRLMEFVTVFFVVKELHL